MKFCSSCGSANISLRIPEGDNRERFVCPDCSTIHYQNPNIVSGCLPVWEDKILLCRRAIEPAHGLWNIPSGYLENGESVADGARREVWEEAIARVEIDYLITLYNLPKINQIYLQFVGQLVDGKFGVGEESLECQLFAEAEIPWDEMAFTSSTFTIRMHFDNQRRGVKTLHRADYPAV